MITIAKDNGFDDNNGDDAMGNVDDIDGNGATDDDINNDDCDGAMDSNNDDDDYDGAMATVRWTTMRTATITTLMATA